MKANRREFLGGLLAIAGAVSVSGVALASMPRLHGDGIHDDGPALAALLAGRPVDADGAIAVRDGGTVYLKNGHTYMIGETIVIEDDDRHLDGNGGMLKCLPGTNEILRLKSGVTGCKLSNIHLLGAEHAAITTWYDTTRP